MDWDRERLIRDLQEYYLNVKLLDNTRALLLSELEATYDELEQIEIKAIAVGRATEEYLDIYGGESW